MGNDRRITLRDVARAAFVSTATVSLSLNNKQGVSEQTRKHVQAVASELGYYRDASAVALREGTQPTVGIFFDLEPADAGSIVGDRDSDRPLLFPLRVATQLMATLSHNGVRPYMLNSDDQVSPVDLLIFVGGREGRAVPRGLSFGTPVVVLGALPSGIQPHVHLQLDHQQMTNDVLDHLNEQGYHQPALILHTGSGPQYVAVAQAYEQWCSHLGVEPQVRIAGSADEAAPIAADLVGNGADAIYDLSGAIAQVLAGVGLAARKVPRDVGVVSRSEGDLAAVTTPPVTSMSMRGQEVGRILGEAAVQALRRSPSLREQITCPYLLTVRESTTRVAPRA